MSDFEFEMAENDAVQHISTHQEEDSTVLGDFKGQDLPQVVQAQSYWLSTEQAAYVPEVVLPYPQG